MAKSASLCAFFLPQRHAWLARLANEFFPATRLGQAQRRQAASSISTGHSLARMEAINTVTQKAPGSNPCPSTVIKAKRIPERFIMLASRRWGGLRNYR